MGGEGIGATGVTISISSSYSGFTLESKVKTRSGRASWRRQKLAYGLKLGVYSFLKIDFIFILIMCVLSVSVGL